MKKYLLFLFCIFNFSVYSQQWEWAKTIGINLPTTFVGSEVHLAPDKSDNFYLSYFRSEPDYRIPCGSTIAKYDSAGNELWLKNFTSKIRIRDIAADGLDAFYVTGDFRDTIDIDGTFLISNGNNDGFLAKFNSNGDLQWIRKSGGLYDDCNGALCLDTQGNIYVTGQYSDSVIFCENISNMTLSKLDPSGNLIFSKASNTPDSLRGYAGGYRIKLDHSGNIIVLGSFNYIQIDTFHLQDGGSYGAQFMCKFDATGQVKWLKEVESSTSRYNDFAVGDDNTIFASGGASWTIGHWTFTARFDSLGNSLWNKGCNLHCGYYRDGVLNGVASDSANIIALGDGGCNGLLLVKYAYDGSLVYLDTIHPTYRIEGKSIVRDYKGKYIISGFIQGSIKLGSDSIYSSTPKIFIAKFSDGPSITSIKNLNEKSELITVFPNPSSGIFSVDLQKRKSKYFFIYVYQFWLKLCLQF